MIASPYKSSCRKQIEEDNDADRTQKFNESIQQTGSCYQVISSKIDSKSHQEKWCQERHPVIRSSPEKHEGKDEIDGDENDIKNNVEFGIGLNRESQSL